jgi:hypothetical protein
MRCVLRQRPGSQRSSTRVDAVADKEPVARAHTPPAAPSPRTPPRPAAGSVRREPSQHRDELHAAGSFGAAPSTHNRQRAARVYALTGASGGRVVGGSGFRGRRASLPTLLRPKAHPIERLAVATSAERSPGRPVDDLVEQLVALPPFGPAWGVRGLERRVG